MSQHTAGSPVPGAIVRPLSEKPPGLFQRFRWWVAEIPELFVDSVSFLFVALRVVFWVGAGVFVAFTVGAPLADWLAS